MPAHELAEAEIVIGEGCRIDLDRAPTDRLLHGASAIEPRAHAALVPAFADELVVFDAPRVFRLQVRELELLPQPVEDVLDLELEHELKVALAAACFAAAF